jgi:hypothetical protein
VPSGNKSRFSEVRLWQAASTAMIRPGKLKAASCDPPNNEASVEAAGAPGIFALGPFFALLARPLANSNNCKA